MVDRSPLLRRRIEVLEFERCTFTYLNLPNLPAQDSNGSGDAAAASSRRKPSAIQAIKAKVTNKAEKIQRKANEIVSGQDTIRRFSEGCQFRSRSDKVIIQNYVSSLELPLQLRFADCTFEYRDKSFCEKFWSFILSCFGAPFTSTDIQGVATIESDTFALNEISQLIDKVILRAQRNFIEDSYNEP